MLKVSAEKLGSVAVLHFEGRIVNGEAIKILRDAVQVQAEACAVILDLAKVDVVDAGGLGVLLELREWSQTRGIELRLTNVRTLVRQVLEITRLDAVFKTDFPADVLTEAEKLNRPRSPGLVCLDGVAKPVVRT